MECRAKQMYEAYSAGSQAMAKYFPMLIWKHVAYTEG